VGYQRHNRTLLGGKSRNLGNQNLLTTRQKAGDSPRNVSLTGTIQSNASWNLTASWIFPTGVTPTGYTIELQNTIVVPQAWISPQTVGGTTVTFNNVQEGIYKVRVRTNYAGGPSGWVESNLVNAFINIGFNFNSQLQMLAGQGSFSSG
jgi:hypothetical protein